LTERSAPNEDGDDLDLDAPLTLTDYIEIIAADSASIISQGTFHMRSLLIASSLLLASIASASAAPPSSCAGKFIGEWRHSGSGNRGSVLADGRALCSEHPACVQGTWTCSGNVLIYTNPVGTGNYTLAPDGRTMSTGSAVSTRLGPVPASARSRDLGTASNVAADVFGIDRTPSAAPPAAAPVAPAKPTTAAAIPNGADPEAVANAKEARKFFQAGMAAAKRGDWSAAEDNFSVARERFRSAKMPNDAETAAGNARTAGNNRLRQAAVRADAKPNAAGKQAAVGKQAGTKPSKEECERVGYINIAIVDRATTPQQRAGLIRDRDRLKARCR
jgi:hypothetical protein